MKYILRYRVLILLVSITLTAIFGVQIKHLTRDAGDAVHRQAENPGRRHEQGVGNVHMS